MSVLTRISSLGRHRGKTPAQLRAELDEADCHLIALATEVDEARSAHTSVEAQLDAAGIELSGAREDLAAAKRTVAQLEAVVKLRDQQIDELAERIRIGIGAEHVIARTQEIDARDMQARFASGLVVTLARSPRAADPAHIPAQAA
ncbi:hypothetical protein [Streptomyces sp. NBC_01022]|uniref:hypothetical protein n=1 Tax=Streptomyces sp. NBC_01022 TaxID=2903723 RepID=UPI002DDC1B1E|nr:hypothetical protein [Streptomyces sp. NBC_01022]WRZ84802.1 hypothetical protein OG316_33360 [Streptomyces sp. NBC_01022]